MFQKEKINDLTLSKLPDIATNSFADICVANEFKLIAMDNSGCGISTSATSSTLDI